MSRLEISLIGRSRQTGMSSRRIAEATSFPDRSLGYPLLLARTWCSIKSSAATPKEFAFRLACSFSARSCAAISSARSLAILAFWSTPRHVAQRLAGVFARLSKKAFRVFRDAAVLGDDAAQELALDAAHDEGDLAGVSDAQAEV